jgi:hypothetical protein
LIVNAEKRVGETSIKPIPAEVIERRIFEIRATKVMLSADLAKLYRVPVRQLNQAVKRNIERFPADFMFQLNKEEAEILKSQIVTSSWGGARRALPYAFTEQGIAMLSAVLRSPTAVAVSIEIVRVFVKLRKMLSSHDLLRRRLDEVEAHLTAHDSRFAHVFAAIRQLMELHDAQRRKPPIGYLTEAKPKWPKRGQKPV